MWMQVEMKLNGLGVIDRSQNVINYVCVTYARIT